MEYKAKEILLKDGRSALLRNPIPEDAAALLEFLRTTAAETDFLLRYPEECNMTLEQERNYIQSSLTSGDSMMILCQVDGVIAGNCNLSRHNKLKTRHRATIGIALTKAFWGLGIGTEMFRELFRVAKELGIGQLELEVFEDNRRALALYQKMGFRIAGQHPNAIRRKDGTLLAEYWIVKEL